MDGGAARGHNVNEKIDIANATQEAIGYHAHLMAQPGLIHAHCTIAIQVGHHSLQLGKLLSI